MSLFNVNLSVLGMVHKADRGLDKMSDHPEVIRMTSVKMAVWFKLKLNHRK